MQIMLPKKNYNQRCNWNFVSLLVICLPSLNINMNSQLSYFKIISSVLCLFTLYDQWWDGVMALMPREAITTKWRKKYVYSCRLDYYSVFHMLKDMLLQAQTDGWCLMEKVPEDE